MRRRPRGEIVATGTPEHVAREPRSYTGQFLKPVLAKARRRGEPGAVG